MGSSDKAGFGISESHIYHIPPGQQTASEAVLDLGRPYGFLIIACPDTSKAAAAANTLSIRVSARTDGPLYKLNDAENAAIAAQIGSDGTFWRVYFAGAVRRVQLVISANVVNIAGLDFEIIGSDSAVEN